MALKEYLAKLQQLRQEAAESFSAVCDEEALEAARIRFLGAKQGLLKDAQKGMGGVEKGDKPAAGKQFNETKQAIEAAFATAQQRIDEAADAGSSDESFDPTLPGVRRRLGHVHPLTQTIEELKDLM
ncbi:MAG: phenylalanine--tRNA ligase subunit alpha, partial [Pirellulales bacterium]